jgi:hypothetical protein
MKTEEEIRAKLEEMLSVDCTRASRYAPGLTDPAKLIFSKAAACKTLLWVLDENDDDRWHITAVPGPPKQVSVV